MNKNLPIFSILMANYNNSRYIKEAIESVLEQTLSDWELIIVDDCSSDNSIETIKPFLEDKRIKLIRQRNNLGYGATMRNCAENARGEFFGILDSDDVLEKNALEVINQKFKENTDCGFFYSNSYICDEGLKFKRISTWIGKINEGRTNLHEDKVAHFRTFRKKDYYKTDGFDSNLKRAVDKDIIYKLEEVTKLEYVDLPLYYYRENRNGISQGGNRKAAYTSHAVVILSAYKRRLKNGFLNLSDKEVSTRLLRMLPGCFGGSSWKSVIIIFVESIRIFPKNIIFVPFLIFGERVVNKITKEFSPYVK